MKRFLLLCVMLATHGLFARSVTVELVAEKELVQDYSGSVLLGVKYDDGTFSAAEVFSLKDLSSGTTKKPFNISDEKTIESCEYQWAIMQNRPRPHGEPPRQTAELLLPQGFPSPIRKQCEVGQDDKIVLSAEPYRLEAFQVLAKNSALKRKNAHLLIVSLRPVGKLDKYSSKALTLDEQSPQEVEFKGMAFIQGPMKLAIEETWFMKDGTTQSVVTETEDFDVLIE